MAAHSRFQIGETDFHLNEGPAPGLGSTLGVSDWVPSGTCAGALCEQLAQAKVAIPELTAA